MTAAFSHAVRASSDLFLGNRASGPNTKKIVQYKIKSKVNTYKGKGGEVLSGSYLFVIKIIIDVNTNSVTLDANHHLFFILKINCNSFVK